MGRPRLPYDPEKEPQREKYRKWKKADQTRKQIQHRKIISEFLDRPCVDCGVQYSEPCMQADHIQARVHKISWFKGGCGSEKALLEELSRCEVRCANCHILRHAVEGNGTNKPSYHWMNG